MTRTAPSGSARWKWTHAALAIAWCGAGVWTNRRRRRETSRSPLTSISATQPFSECSCRDLTCANDRFSDQVKRGDHLRHRPKTEWWPPSVPRRSTRCRRCLDVTFQTSLKGRTRNERHMDLSRDLGPDCCSRRRARSRRSRQAIGRRGRGKSGRRRTQPEGGSFA